MSIRPFKSIPQEEINVAAIEETRLEFLGSIETLAENGALNDAEKNHIGTFLHTMSYDEMAAMVTIVQHHKALEQARTMAELFVFITND